MIKVKNWRFRKIEFSTLAGKPHNVLGYLSLHIN